MRRGADDGNKTALTFEEKLSVAWAHYVKDIDQHTLAALYSVNPARVSEACSAARDALGGQRKAGKKKGGGDAEV